MGVKSKANYVQWHLLWTGRDKNNMIPWSSSKLGVFPQTFCQRSDLIYIVYNIPPLPQIYLETMIFGGDLRSCETTACLKQRWRSIPDESDALETEMVGAPEFVLWWLTALFSDAESLECTLTTLSAPSGCEQTQKRTPKLLIQYFIVWLSPVCRCCACVLVFVCISCWPWPSGCRCTRTTCLGFENAGYWGPWTTLRTLTPLHCLCKPERTNCQQEYLKLKTST